MSNCIEAVIFDWAGTTIDYGCFAPLMPFVNAFNKFKLTVSFDEVRSAMGLQKLEHVKYLLNLDTVKIQFMKLVESIRSFLVKELVLILFQLL